jgi:hypothetical protein
MKKSIRFKWVMLFLFAFLQITLARPASKMKTGAEDRKYWVSLLDKISTPVLSNMSKGELRKSMPIEFSPIWDGRDKEVAYLECFGRLVAGIAPFLALPANATAEGKIRERILRQTQQSLVHGFNPESTDYLFRASKTAQTLVDAAYIAQALLAAPSALWEPLDTITKNQIITEFVKVRQIKPFNSNWLLFAGMVESFLLQVGEKPNEARIDNAIDKMNEWYVGDGWYSDGEKFHFDHYNGYVIHPMMVEVLRVNVAHGRRDMKEYELAYKRMQRYGSFQERYISPEGTYPVFGRSSTYRVGAFQPLVKLALDHKLPEEINPAQVRCALTAVMKNMFIQSTFRKGDWLRMGLVGDKQENLADYYTNTGSVYITSLVFLSLGLPASDEFWSAPNTEWTQKKAWSGKAVKKDYAVDY